ncbi:MAG: acyl-CoA dehydrogenase family protein [Burkholderiales bacterium]
MEFDLSEEQRLIDASLRGYLADAMPLDRVRAVAAGRSGFDAALWAGLCGLGLPGLVIAEKFGGSGLGLLEAAVVAEALGHAATPAPFVGPCVMAPLAISIVGSAEQQSRWLPRIAGGEMRIAIACGALSGATGATRFELSAGRISGQVDSVLDAAGATHALLYAADGAAFMIALDAPGVKTVPRPTLDRTRPLIDLHLSGAESEPLAGGSDALAAAKRVLDAGRVMLAADTLGAASRMIDKAVAYALEREQFGRVIAAFQAVKHMCAEMAAELEPCRALIWYAATIQDQGEAEERRTLACLTKAHLSEVGRNVARTATEVHGGMGFTDLMGLHYWFKRIAFDRQVLGGPERCRAEAAQAQGWNVSTS